MDAATQGTQGAGQGTFSEASAVSRLALHTPGWREDAAPDRNETVPRGRLARDLVALGCAALLLGAGLRLWLGQGGAGASPVAQAAQAAGTGGVRAAP